MDYEIKFTKKAIKVFLKLPRKVQINIRGKLLILSKGPFSVSNVKRLQGVDNAYRLRMGNYRIIYLVLEQELIIKIIKIGHRREVYR